MLEQVLIHQRGVSYPAVLDKNVRAASIPLPPLSDQQRIVDTLEDHLSRLDAADSYLGVQEEKLNSLIASVLLNDDVLAAADRRPLKSLLSESLANGRSVPTRDGGFPVLRLTALTGDGIDLSERKGGAWIEDEARPFLVHRGDFLVSRGNGSLRLVARGGLVRDEPDGIAYPDTLIRVRTDSALVNPEYLAAVWNSSIIREQIESMARTTAGIYKVNQKHLESVELPLPTLNEQERISARIEETQGVVARLRSTTSLAESRTAALRQALLAAAFSGQLTRRSSDTDRVEEMADA